MKILVVEDEPKTLNAIRQGLEETQFEVDIAERVWDLNFDSRTNVVEVYIN